MDVSVSKEIGGDLPRDLREKSMMQCTSNFEDHSFYNVEDQTENHCNASSKKEVEEDDVDILGLIDKNEFEVSGCNDGTDEYSSSFNGTGSEDENDQEADSMLSPTDTSLPFWMRKKKLTDHWRRAIKPIMWRCKWIELKIKEFQNQASKYDKEIEESCQAKQLALETSKSEELGVKTLPYLPRHPRENRVKKRIKRKRIEETTDIATYSSNHNLFSYNECRRSFGDIALNDKRNKILKDETVFYEETPPLLEFKEGDAYLEQILLKIEAAKSEARNLKNRLDKVLSEIPNLPGSADVLLIENEDEKPIKSASVSSHDNEEDDETEDILLSEMISKRRGGKAIVPKLKKIEQTSVEEGSSRPARKRTPRNLEVKEETNPKRLRVSREKPKSNVTTTSSSRFKLANRKRKRGKRRSGSSTGSRRRT